MDLHHPFTNWTRFWTRLFFYTYLRWQEVNYFFKLQTKNWILNWKTANTFIVWGGGETSSSLMYFNGGHYFALKQRQHITVTVHFFLNYGIVVIVTAGFKEKSIVSLLGQVVFKLLQRRCSTARYFNTIRYIFIAKWIDNGGSGFGKLTFSWYWGRCKDILLR